MKRQATRALGWLALALLCAASARAASDYGKLSGVVVDPAGTPQMGATVWIIPEEALGAAGRQALTNHRGVFLNEQVLPGLYTVRVTLAGFLPSLERHIRVRPNLTTLVRVELDSVFSSFDRLRRQPQPAAEDEWTWVLRASAATRPVLRFVNGDVVVEVAGEESARRRRPHGRVELTSGARRPGSVSNLADAAGSAFAYEQPLGHTGRLLLAGQMSYERSAAGGFATIWLPTGDAKTGAEVTLALRQSKLGPNGQVFRGARVEHSDHLALGERLTVQYGVEYVLAGLGRSTSTLRPRVELEARVSPNWRTSLLIAAQPVFNDDPNATALDSALAALDAFPAVLLRNGRPVLESGWHEELSVERRLSPRVSFVVAGFHDRAGHQAVAGRGSTADPDILQDFYSAGFLYDGGSAGSWGARMAYRQKVSEDLEIAAVYSWAGGIVLAEDPFARPTTLREAFENGYRHSVGARVAGRVPRLGTQVAASYKWVNGPVLTRVDRFGESLYQLDPNFNLCVRQPLPSFNGTRIEALADFNNLLAQGYVPVRMADGRVLLAPSFRSFRGGVSFQF